MFDFRTTAGFATNTKALFMCTRFSYSCSYPAIVLCLSIGKQVSKKIKYVFKNELKLLLISFL
jgi:hypothetical protein